MDIENVVETGLTARRIRAGEALIRRLEDRGFRPTVAMWHYRPESEEWRLVVAHPRVDEEGPLATYRWIFTVLDELDEETREALFARLSLAGPSEPLIQSLLAEAKTGRPLVGARLTNSGVDGTVIEDAYIYRVA